MPPGWERLADRVWREFGHRLVLRSSPEGWDSDDDFIEVLLDGELTGGIGFSWSDDEAIDQVLDDLWDALDHVLVEELENPLPDKPESREAGVGREPS